MKKNITFTLKTETVIAAKAIAKARKTSLSQIVEDYFKNLPEIKEIKNKN